MARLNAWLTPDVGTGETISRCLTFPRSLMPHVVGALSALTEVWRWEAYGDMPPADAAHLATIMLDEFESECGANVLLRQNPTNPCQLERSDDNGETWMMFADTSLCVSEIPETVEYPDDMRLDPVTGDLQYSLDGGETWSDYPTPTTPEPTQPYTPLREVPPGATDEQKRCAAATSAANALNQMYEQTYGAIGAGIANSWGAFSNFMNDLTDFVFGITYGQVWDIVKIIGLWDDIDFETNYAAATLGEEAIEALTCLIYGNTTIDQNGHSQIDFGAVRDNVISELGINPGTAVWTHLNYLQEAGLERIADVGFGSTDCSACSDVAEILLQPQEGGVYVGYEGDGWHLMQSSNAFGAQQISFTYRTLDNPGQVRVFQVLDYEFVTGPYSSVAGLQPHEYGVQLAVSCGAVSPIGVGSAHGAAWSPLPRKGTGVRLRGAGTQFSMRFKIGCP